MRIEQGTHRADVPHKFQSTGESEMGLGPCTVCERLSAAPVHERWVAMNAASRESASQQIPRVHG